MDSSCLSIFFCDVLQSDFINLKRGRKNKKQYGSTLTPDVRQGLNLTQCSRWQERVWADTGLWHFPWEAGTGGLNFFPHGTQFRLTFRKAEPVALVCTTLHCHKVRTVKPKATTPPTWVLPLMCNLLTCKLWSLGYSLWVWTVLAVGNKNPGSSITLLPSFICFIKTHKNAGCIGEKKKKN